MESTFNYEIGEMMRKEAIIILILIFGLFPLNGQSEPEFFSKIKALRIEGKSEKALELTTSELAKYDPNNPENLEQYSTLVFLKGLIEFDLAQFDKAEDDFQKAGEFKSPLLEYALYQQSLIIKNKIEQFETSPVNQSPEKQKELNDESELLVVIYEKIKKLSPNIKMKNEIEFNLSQIQNLKKKFSLSVKILRQLEKKNRGTGQYSDIVYELAKAEKGIKNQRQYCKWIKKLYTNYPEYKKISTWNLDLYENVFEGEKTKCLATTDDKKNRIKNLQWAGLDIEAQKEINELKNGNEFEKAEAKRLFVSFYLHAGDVQKSFDMLKDGYDSRAKDAQYLLSLGSIAARMDDPQLAIGSYYKASKILGRSKKGRQALYQAAQLSYQFQDYDGASRKFKEFIKLNPGSGLSVDARWQLAWIQYLKGEYKKSYDALELLIRPVRLRKGKTKPVNKFVLERAHYWMAMNKLKLGDYQQARELFNKLNEDKLFGYYSIAATNRIKKIDESYPKINFLKTQPGVYNKNLSINIPLIADNFSLSDFEQESSTNVLKEIKNDMSLSSSSNEKKEANQNSVTMTGESQDSEENDSVKDLVSLEEDANQQIKSEDLNEEEGITFSNPQMLKRFDRAKILMSLGLNEWAKWDLYDIERKTSNKEILKSLMEEYEVVENYQRSSYIGQVYFGQQRRNEGLDGNRHLWEFTYPKAYAGIVNKYSKKYEIPSELIWGIMRAESQYKKDVISPVGALGLMQVMPITGRKVASIIDEDNFEPKRLIEPDSAVKIGGKYLQRLMKKFDSQLPLVAAAYNAGPHRVIGWLNHFGDLETDEFIEHIPFLETRLYVKKVLSNYYIYNRLYGKKDEKSDEKILKTTGNIKYSLQDGGSQKESWDDI